jgi:Ca2+:H+ antiporter
MDGVYRDSEAGVKSSRPDFTLMGQLRATIFRSWINILFLMIPVGIALNFMHINPVATFITNFVAIIPLAAMLSDATEQIAYHIGETLGGLLNATFG